MTGRTIAQMRQADLQKIHIAKKQLGWSDDEYRAVIMRISKDASDSAGELNHKQRAELLAYMKFCRFKVRHARKDNAGKRRTPSRPIAERSDQLKMMRALWLRLHESGAIENADEQGLVTFATKHTRIQALEWLSVEQNQKLIEILKNWLERVRIKPFRESYYNLHPLGKRIGMKSDRFIRNELQKILKVDVVECDLLQYQACLAKVRNGLQNQQQ